MNSKLIREARKFIASKILLPKIINTQISFYDHKFDELQEKYNPIIHEYGYDSVNSWVRAAKRLITILNLTSDPIVGTNFKLLDAACGDGMLGVLAKSFGLEPFLTDIEDWRDNRAKQLPFSIQHLEDLSEIKTDQFDLVCSFNAFEHLADPRAAFEELLRVCKPHGHVFLEFGPLYNGPWGLHAYKTLFMPYPQFLFSEELINQKLEELGIFDLGKSIAKLQPLNKLKYSDFSSIWNLHHNCHIIMQNRIKNENFLEVIIKFPRAFQGRDITFEELTTQAIQVLIKKRKSIT